MASFFIFKGGEGVAEYDGSIRIGTGIDTKEFKAGSKEIETEARRMAKTVSSSLGDSAKIALQKQTDAFVKQNQQYAAQEQKIKDLGVKLHELQRTQIETPVFKETSKELASAEKKLDSLYGRLRELKAAGKENTAPYKQAIAQIDIYKEKVSELQNQLKELKYSGEAYQPADTSKIQQEIAAAEQKQMQMYTALQTSADALTSKIAQSVEKESERSVKLAEEEAEEERLAAIRENAVVGNQRIVEAMERRKELAQELADLEAAGVTKGYVDYDTRIEELAQLDQKIKDYAGSIEHMTASYRKFQETLAGMRNSATGLVNPLNAAKATLVYIADSMKERLKKLSSSIKNGITHPFKTFKNTATSSVEKVNELLSKMRSVISKTGSGIKKFGGFVKKAFSGLTKSTKKSNGLLATMGSRFRGLALSLLIFNQISKAFNAIISGMKEGFGNLYNEVSGFKSAIDGLKASSLTLKNSFAAAFRPLVETAIPYINQAINAMIDFMNIVGQFTAAITGQKTYTKAIRMTTDAIEDETKAQNKQLSGLDKLNNLTTGDNGNDGGSSTKMFEENVPVSNGISKAADKIKKIFSEIFDTFKKSWDRKGKNVIDSAKRALKSLSKSAKSVSDTLYNVFTGTVGLDWVDSLIGGFESILGIIQSISTAFSAAWDSGAGDEAVSSIFNGLKEVNGLLSSIGDSFSRAFSGEIGTEIFENLLGILEGIFNTIENIAGQIQTAWDTAGLGDGIWNGILEIANTILETIHNITDSTAGWARELDFTPLLESISRLLTSLQPLAENIGEGLEWFWNNVLLPVAGWVIEDAVPTFLDLLSVAIDTVNQTIEVFKPVFQWFWDEFLEPLGKWAGETIISAMEKITDLLKKFGDWISEHKGEVTEFIEIIGLLAAGFFSVKEGIALVKNILPLFKSGIKGAASMLFSPLGLVAALAALVVATGNGEEMIENLKTALGGILDFITGIFTLNWEKAWEGVKKIFEGIGGAIGTVLDSILDGINWVLEKIGILNKTQIKPKEVSKAIAGGATNSPFSVSSVQSMDIPGYATGQVIPRSMRKHLAILGDNNRETEVVSPLSTIKQALREEALSLGLTGGGGGGAQELTIHIPVEIDGRTLFELVQKFDREEYGRTKRPSFQM